MLLIDYRNKLENSTFIRRYKRFFVDVELENKKILTVHCANSGSMKSCLVENAATYILNSMNIKRKLQYSLELIQLEDGLACLNTMRANQFVNQLFIKTISQNNIDVFLESNFPYQYFLQWEHFKSEVVFSNKTRFDFCLTSFKHNKKCWIEVKSVSLRLSNNTWAFPDAVTLRGQKHLVELINAKKNGDEAWLFFVLMRGDNISDIQLRNGFRAAYEIDPVYSKLLDDAKNIGVNIALLLPKISLDGISLRNFFILNKNY